METNENSPKQRVILTLRITDYATSKGFYVDGLGFQIDWEHRFKPHFSDSGAGVWNELQNFRANWRL